MQLIHPKYCYPKNFRQNPGAGYTKMRVIHPCLRYSLLRRALDFMDKVYPCTARNFSSKFKQACLPFRSLCPKGIGRTADAHQTKGAAIPSYLSSYYCSGGYLEERSYSGFSLRAFKRGPQGLAMWSKGVLDYDSMFCCFKEVKTTGKILIILAILTRNTSKYESIDK